MRTRSLTAWSVRQIWRNCTPSEFFVVKLSVKGRARNCEFTRPSVYTSDTSLLRRWSSKGSLYLLLLLVLLLVAVAVLVVGNSIGIWVGVGGLLFAHAKIVCHNIT